MHELLAGALEVGLTIADLTGPGSPLVYVNDTFSTLTGYAREEAIGRNCRFLQGPESDPETVRRLSRAIRLREPITVELINYRKDGSRFWNLLSIAPLPDGDGHVTRLVGVQRDISAIKARQRQQATAQRLAALGELAGGIAHGFNNLLAVVLGSCELLCRQEHGHPEITGPVEAIRAAAQRGVDQVKRLMTLTAAPMLDVKAIDLRNIGDELVLMLRGVLPPLVRLHLDIAPHTRWVLGDAPQLEGALLNLVLNARDAMPQGGNIWIESKQQKRGTQNWVVLSVRDDGAGMDDATMQRVFDPFFTTRVDRSGHGLGLAMVHAYVRNVGGEVSVQSALGRGSLFSLHLPAAMPAHSTETEGAQPDLSTASPARRAGSALLVDDDDVLRFVAGSMLKQIGYQVVACSGADQALQLLANGQSIDLLWTDYLLGESMNGADLAAEARSRFPRLPIVLSSGWTETVLSAGEFDAFLAKPFTLKSMISAIDKASVRRSATT